MSSSTNRAEDAGRTNSTYHGDDKPTRMYLSEGFQITEAVREACESILGKEHRLNKLDNVDAIHEVFYGLSVIRKC